MPSKPLISFVIPADDDDAAMDRTLRACLAQSLAAIEVVCVRSDASMTRPTETLADSRVRSIVQPPGSPAAQLRKAGIAAANAPFVLFLEPGDSVDPELAARLHREAAESNAQLVGISIRVTHGGKTANLTPAEGPLEGPDILSALIPRETAARLKPANVVFRTDLIREAYATPAVDASPLVDDRAVMLLAYASAASYASIRDLGIARRSALNRSDHDGGFLGRTLEGITAFRSVEPIIRDLARDSPNPEPLLESYSAGHLTAVAEALTAFAALPVQQRVHESPRLWQHVDELDAVAAAVGFAPATLPAIIAHGQRRELGGAPIRSVLLTTNVLTTGGVSGVLLTQARFLLDAGYRVTIATHRTGSAESLVPEGASLVQVTGTSRRQRVTQWAQLCRLHDVDVVIDHRVLYSRDWPGYALAARAAGAATIGWIHNFAGRPTYNGNDLQSLLQTHLGALAHLIVLSPLDVAFWKLRGISHVSYLPNPPSPILLGADRAAEAKSVPLNRRLELVWWGRLEEHTKKVTQLLEIAAALKRSGTDFRLRIVGPDWTDMTSQRLAAVAEKRGLTELVEITGPRHGQDLLDIVDSSDIFINTSIIEGYLLTIPEAQSRGLPVVMYDLPWLLSVQNNPGVISVPQGDAEAAAGAVTALANDEGRYAELSRASLSAARSATSYDFAQLYQQLVSGDLPVGFSPEPTIEDGRSILNLLVFFAEHSGTPSAANVKRPQRARGVSRRQTQSQSIGARLERKLTPIGHQLLAVAPWLRPFAQRVKQRLLRR